MTPMPPRFFTPYLSNARCAHRGAVSLDARGQYSSPRLRRGAICAPPQYLPPPINSNGKAGDLTSHWRLQLVIYKASMKKLGLASEGTEIPVHGVFGKGPEKVGITSIRSLSMGNCQLLNVKAAVLSGPESGGIFRPYGTSDGLFGLREMLRYGAVLDLGKRLLFVHPGGARKNISAGIRSLLTGQGYTAVPISLDRRHCMSPHGQWHPLHLIVDTGCSSPRSTGIYAQGGSVVTAPMRMHAASTAPLADRSGRVSSRNSRSGARDPERECCGQ